MISDLQNPNEEFNEFCNNLEKSILQIKNDCKYLAPLHIHELWSNNKHKFLTNHSKNSVGVDVGVGENNSGNDKIEEVNNPTVINFDDTANVFDDVQDIDKSNTNNKFNIPPDSTEI